MATVKVKAHTRRDGTKVKAYSYETGKRKTPVKRKKSGKSRKERAAIDKREGVTKSGARAGWGSLRGLAVRMRSGKHRDSNVKIAKRTKR